MEGSQRQPFKERRNAISLPPSQPSRLKSTASRLPTLILDEGGCAAQRRALRAEEKQLLAEVQLVNAQVKELRETAARLERIIADDKIEISVQVQSFNGDAKELRDTVAKLERMVEGDRLKIEKLGGARGTLWKRLWDIWRRVYRCSKYRDFMKDGERSGGTEKVVVDAAQSGGIPSSLRNDEEEGKGGARQSVGCDRPRLPRLSV